MESSYIDCEDDTNDTLFVSRFTKYRKLNKLGVFSGFSIHDKNKGEISTPLSVPLQFDERASMVYVPF